MRRSGDPAGAAVQAASSRDDHHPVAWTDDSGLFKAGFGRVAFKARDGHDLIAMVYRSRPFDPAKGPIWFVMHGASRDAERYVRAAAPVAERYGALAVVPHFTKQAYPNGTDYTLNSDLYATIEQLFEATRRSLRGHQQGYYLFRTQRRSTVHPPTPYVPPGSACARSRRGQCRVVHAPRRRRPSQPRDPLRSEGSPIGPKDLRGFFAMPFAVLLGDRDTTTAETDEMVRGTREAEAQGPRGSRGAGSISTSPRRSRRRCMRISDGGWRSSREPDTTRRT